MNNCLLILIISNFLNNNEKNLEIGKNLFIKNCNQCHIDQKNLILPEKKLTSLSLKINGLEKYESIYYEIVNGKNGMPGFGNRLSKKEINLIINYILNTFIDK